MKKIKIKSTILRLPQGLRPFAMTGRKLSKKALAAFFTFILVILPVTLLILFNSAKGVEAAWVNEDWGYRYPINITNSTGSIQTNLQKLLTIDTSTLVTAGKLQSDCDDLRFTAQNGTILPYYIDSGCNTTTTKVWVLIDNLPTNGSVIYMYYGNPGATVGSSAKEFDNVVGLVGYWTMNDTSGSTATDSSVNANNGTATGTTIVSGQKGNARSFNGTSDYISVTTTGASFTVQTVEAWIYKTGDGYIIDQGGNNNWMQVYGGRIRGGTDASGYCDGSTTIASNTWYHVVKVNDGITNKIYVNGNLDCSNTIGIGSPGAITIGQYGGGGFFFPGQIDDVRIYNTARTADQISSDYTKTYTIQTSPLTVTTANGSEEKAPSPVAYWKFDDGTGTTAQDSTTNNNDGTLTNGPTWQTEDMCVSGKCLKFDGTDDYTSVADSDKIDFTASQDFSISSWIKVPSSQTTTANIDNDIIEKWSGSGGYPFTIRFYNSTAGGSANKIAAARYDGTNNPTVTSTSTFNDNKWHHVSFVKSGSTLYLYVDGKQEATTTDTTSGTTTNSSELFLGRRGGGTAQSWQGMLDDLKIYNYARSADQIKADYNSRANAEGAASVLGTASNNNYKALNDGLVGYWKMDESSWTNNCSTTSVTDSSGNSNNGKACPATTGPTGGASGKFGNAGSFDGSDDYVEVPNNSSLNPGTGDFTITAWVDPSSYAGGAYPRIVARNNFAFEFAITNGGALVAYDGSWRESSLNIGTSEGWVFVAIKRVGTTLTFFKGTSSQTMTGGTAPNVTGSIYIGSDYTNTDQWTGQMDEIRIYNRALSPAEVTQLYNFAPGPVAYYNFEENTGTTVNDRSGNGNTGTWNGSGSPKWKPGKYGAAGNFDGSSDTVTLANESNFDFDRTNAFTISGWVKTSGTNSVLFAKMANGGTYVGYDLFIQSSTGYPIVQLISSWSSDAIEVASTKSVSDGNWHFIAATYSGSSAASGVKIYVDGVQTSVTNNIDSLSSSILNNITPSIGSRNNQAYYLSGQIDDVKVYNYARTQQQIIEDMTNGSDVDGSGYVSSSSSTGGSIAKPVGYWRFDEGYGTTVNNVGNGGSSLNGTLTNMASPATSTSGWTQAGKVGKGLVFDGTDDYVSLPNDSALNITSNQITMSAWVYRTVTGDFDQVISKATGTGSSSRQYAMYIDATAGGLGCNVVAGSVVDLISSIIRVTTNTWTHISCVYDGATLKGYVNGIQASSTALTGNIVTQNTGVNIGRFNTGVSYFNGTLDEVKIYNFPLTADQVKLDMNQGAALVLGSASNNSSYEVNAANQEYCIPGDTATCSAPVGRWDFDEATGTTANDSSGNANTGTLTNGPTWKPGKVNKSLSFDGTDDYVTFTNSSSIQGIASAGTISAWVKYTTNDATLRTLVDIAGTGNNGLILFSQGTGGIPAIQYGTGSSTQAIFATTIPVTNTWYHLTFTWNSSGGKVYVNGIQEGSNSTVPSITISGSGYIGANSGNTRFHNGQIDQVRIFNYARTASQIAWDYNKGAPVGHWRMDECQGTSAKDVSGNNNTGTITIGSGGTQTSAGTCTDGLSTSAWYNGRTGKKNYSLNFDGTDDYVNISNLTLGSTFSISSWIKPTTYNGNYPMWITANGVPDLELGGQTGGTLFYSGGQYFSTSFSSLPLDTWSYLTYVVSSGNIQLYINGILKETKSYTPTSLSTINLGQYFNNTSRFGGSLDDVRVYNYPLTATQVKTLFSEGAYRSGPSTGAP